MKGKTLLMLVVAAAVLGAVAVFTSRDGETTKPEILGQPVFSDLPVNDVARIALRSSDVQSSVVRNGETWVVPDRYNYPADFAKIKNLLLKLADLEIGQIVLADERQRRTLKMLSPDAEKADGEETGILLDLDGVDGVDIASLLIGAVHMRSARGQGAYGGYPDGNYVSPDAGENIYLVAEVLDDLPKEPRDWLDPEFVSVPASDVTRIIIAGPDSEEVRLVRGEESSQLEMEGLADDEEMDSSRLYGIESALSYLGFEDVADPTLTDENLGMDKPTLFTVETKKDEVYTVRLGGTAEESGKRYASIAVALKDVEEKDSATEKTDEDADPAKKAEEDKKQAEREEAEAKVSGINDRLGRWTYLIAAHKADSMLTRRDDLVKAREKTGEQDNARGDEKK